jgi:hypothetical protein
MWLQVKIKKMFAGFFRPTPKLSDRDRLRNQLVKEVAYAEALAGFLLNGYNRGHAVKITVEIDGLGCEVAILASGEEALFEYLCNWVCAEKVRKHIRLEEFDQQGRGGSGSLPVDNALGAKSDDPTEFEGGWPKKWRS